MGEARLACEILLSRAIGCRRIDLYSRFEDEPSSEAMDRFRDWVKRAADHEPIAYLVGEKEFFSLAFTVTRDVLVPRPETETLVEWVLDDCRTSERASPHVLDVGTGSGCIAIAVLANLPEARPVGCDISSAAFKVATDNADRHGASELVKPGEAAGRRATGAGVGRVQGRGGEG